MSNYPTRAGVEEASELTFPDIRRITISCQVHYRGRYLTVAFEGYTADEACDLLDRRFGPSQTNGLVSITPPASTDTNAPICPTHGKEMRNNGKGWFCPSRVGDGWCRERAK